MRFLSDVGPHLSPSLGGGRAGCGIWVRVNFLGHGCSTLSELPGRSREGRVRVASWSFVAYFCSPPQGNLTSRAGTLRWAALGGSAPRLCQALGGSVSWTGGLHSGTQVCLPPARIPARAPGLSSPVPAPSSLLDPCSPSRLCPHHQLLSLPPSAY